MSISEKTPQRAVMHFCYKLNKSPLDTVKMINDTYGESRVNRRLVYRWFQRFREGDESFEDQQRTGRPVCGRSDKNVKSVSDAVNEDRHSTIRSMCEKLDLSYGTVQRILKNDLKMRRVSAKWVHHLLKDEEMAARVQESKRFLRRWRKEGDAFLQRIITADETWVYFYDPGSKMQSSQWKHVDSPPTARKIRLTIDCIGMETLPHPAYSPDLAPCDFALFPYLKGQLRGTQYHSLEELRIACNNVFTSLSKDWYANVFRQWANRCERCIEHQGGYFEKE